MNQEIFGHRRIFNGVKLPAPGEREREAKQVALIFFDFSFGLQSVFFGGSERPRSILRWQHLYPFRRLPSHFAPSLDRYIDLSVEVRTTGMVCRCGYGNDNADAP